MKECWDNFEEMLADMARQEDHYHTRGYGEGFTPEDILRHAVPQAWLYAELERLTGLNAYDVEHLTCNGNRLGEWPYENVVDRPLTVQDIRQAVEALRKDRNDLRPQE